MFNFQFFHVFLLINTFCYTKEFILTLWSYLQQVLVQFQSNRLYWNLPLLTQFTKVNSIENILTFCQVLFYANDSFGNPKSNIWEISNGWAWGPEIGPWLSIHTISKILSLKTITSLPNLLGKRKIPSYQYDELCSHSFSVWKLINRTR